MDKEPKAPKETGPFIYNDPEGRFTIGAETKDELTKKVKEFKKGAK